eukprot:198848-Chlamydomonas_euryale.AAC.2
MPLRGMVGSAMEHWWAAAYGVHARWVAGCAAVQRELCHRAAWAALPCSVGSATEHWWAAVYGVFTRCAAAQPALRRHSSCRGPCWASDALPSSALAAGTGAHQISCPAALPQRGLGLPHAELGK